MAPGGVGAGTARFDGARAQRVDAVKVELAVAVQATGALRIDGGEDTGSNQRGQVSLYSEKWET